MAETPSAPELVQAYRLLKAGDRPAAGQVLKAYLADHPRDAKGWWLMAHVVTQPDSVRRCLETVLKLDPGHAKARARLDQLLGTSDDEPDDHFFLGTAGPASSTAAPAVSAPKPEPVEKVRLVPEVTPPPMHESAFAASFAANEPLTMPDSSDAVPSFETYLQADPFAPPDHDDPFAGIGGTQVPVGAAFVRGTIGSDPAAPGTAADGTPADFGSATFEDDEQRSVERLIGYGLIGVAIVVGVALLLFVADRQGWISVGDHGDSVPTLTTLDSGSFTIDYPRQWDMRCETESSGYPVCGIANHKLYNEVDTFAGTPVDIGQMLAESLSIGLTGGDLPDTEVSIIVMDVPPTSPAYDNGSWAKTLYELYTEGWNWDSEAKVDYVTTERQIAGYTAYYYRYSSEGRWKSSAWDVYIPHDGLTLWMRATFWGKQRSTIPDNLIEAMIDSIAFTSGEDAAGAS